MFSRTRTPGLSLIQRVRHALSDLLARPWTAALNATSVSVAVVSLLVLGFIGLSVYRYREAVMNESPVTRTIVSAKDVTDPHQRLTEAKLAELAARFGARVFPKIEVGGRVFTNPDAPTTATAEGTVDGDPMVAQARLAWGRPPANGSEAVVPVALFEKLGGRMTRSGPSIDKLTFEVARTTNGKDESHRVTLRLVGLARAADEKLYVTLPLAISLDQWCMHSIESMPGADGRVERPQFKPSAVLAFGPLSHAGRVKADTEHLAADVKKLHEFDVPHATGDSWLAIDTNDPSAVIAKLAGKVELHPYTHAIARIAVAGKPFTLIVLDRHDPRWGDAGMPPVDGEIYLTASDKAADFFPPTVRVVERSVMRFPPGDAHCTLATFLRIAFADVGTVTTTPLALLNAYPALTQTAGLSLRVSPLHLATVRRELSGADVTFRTITPSASTAMVAYELTPKPDSPGMLDLVGAVRFSRPTFTDATPVIRVKATSGRTPLTLDATGANDPRRFAAGVMSGTWPTENAFEVVLPADVVAKLFPNEAPVQCAGRDVTITFERERVGNDFDRTLEISVRLVGVTTTGTGQGGFISESLAANITLWREGKVIYGSTRKVFESPLTRYERAGFARCNLDVSSPDKVGEVVTRLQAEGYPVTHRLGELQGQQKLGRVLAVVVLVLVGGYLLSGAITVFSSNAQQVAGKVYEIGVLRALGMGPREVVSLFAMQGFMTGVVAFLLGAGLALALEPLVSRTLIATCGVPPEALPARLASASCLPLLGGALVVAVVASTIGAVVPAIRASRLDLVDSMRRVG